MTNELIGQILGFISLGFYVYAYQIKDPRKTMLWFMPGTFLYGLQYLFLGSFSSFLIMLVAAIREFFGAYGSDRQLQLIIGIYLILVWGITFFAVEHWQELLVPIATSLASLAFLCRDHFYKFRILMGVHHILWFAFNIWMGAIAGFLITLMSASSNLIGMYRYYRGQKLEGLQKDPPLEP